MFEVRVSSLGKGYSTIREALDSLPPLGFARVIIENGVYREKLRIMRPDTLLEGESARDTIISWDDYAYRLLPNGETMNTFNSYTVYAGAENVTIKNMTIENASGPACGKGQAIALYADADRLMFRNCRLLGFQDTLCTGPLPKNPVPKGLNLIHPMLGCGEEEYSLPVRQFFDQCYIEGDVDFIFGSATVYFRNCEIFSKNKNEEINGFITAASTSPKYLYGYVFDHCTLKSDAPPRTVYLGRPWRDYARVIFMHCDIGAHIKPEGWHNWDLPLREKTVTYREYGNTGEGSCGKRVLWSHDLSDDEASDISVHTVFSGNDGWDPGKE
jgi:pectinesterase